MCPVDFFPLPAGELRLLPSPPWGEGQGEGRGRSLSLEAEPLDGPCGAYPLLPLVCGLWGTVRFSGGRRPA